MKNSNLFQIKYVPYIESICANIVFCVSFFSLSIRTPYIPRPSYDYPPIDLLLFDLSVLYSIILSLSISSQKKKWSVFVAWLDMLDFFFQCFPFYFRFILRAPSCYYTWLKKTKQKSKKFVNLLPSFIQHTTKHEKNGRTFFPHHLIGHFKLTSRAYILNPTKLEPDLVTFWSNHWIKTSNIKRIKEKSGPDESHRHREKKKKLNNSIWVFNYFQFFLSSSGDCLNLVLRRFVWPTLSLSSILSYSEFLWQLRSYSQIHSTYFIL